ncbi:hypothetical protein NDU88_010751 [Pleurodeles waltl]|uniref:Secreted protein n=1 Tax=Pleurodeles waltl TaxID=8319 RepID=A0AAV7RZW5_PLEWA|nr:hypothetical protein NDU88_010751 [Pleurodeles waltl]
MCGCGRWASAGLRVAMAGLTARWSRTAVDVRGWQAGRDSRSAAVDGPNGTSGGQCGTVWVPRRHCSVAGRHLRRAGWR